ncbi:MAG: hypothetical protein AB2448_11425 [Moorella sp. (in: firmicutes)]
MAEHDAVFWLQTLPGLPAVSRRPGSAACLRGWLMTKTLRHVAVNLLKTFPGRLFCRSLFPYGSHLA